MCLQEIRMRIYDLRERSRIWMYNQLKNKIQQSQKMHYFILKMLKFFFLNVKKAEQLFTIRG